MPRRRALLGGPLALAACVAPRPAATQEATPEPALAAETQPATPEPTTAAAAPAPAFTSPPQIRAFWVDAFHDGIKTPAQVEKLVRDAQTAHANTLIVQVRRRGDAYYNRTSEPRTDDRTLHPGFDGLQALIERAHAARPRLEVHAWMATVALWKEQLTPPADPAHTFNTHGPAATGDDLWLSLNDRGQAWDNENYMLDPGHPAVTPYVAGVAEELTRNYDVDGIHLDLVRYAGAQWGYNPLSLARFRRRHGLPESSTPGPSDARWQQWRRDQVSALVRRVYLDCVAVKPAVKVSAAVIGWGAGPTDETSWRRTSTYANVFQDWKAWLEEGIVDLALPMNYDDEANEEQRAWFDRWVAWGRERQGNRQTAIGVGLFLNKPEAGLAQIRRALAAGPRGAQAAGVALYSYAVSNLPPRGSDEPELPNARFFERLGAEDGPFTGLAPVPELPWKGQPVGHVRGVVRLAGVPVDGVTVRLDGPKRVTVVSDGSGYFGSVDLTPGAYGLSVTVAGRSISGSAEVSAGQVATVSLEA
ncbi:MAG TPA: family 10 glycosylhydrolase [Chloroflexota bacterium]|nr:family 10 glycosylhydrolase [Chloroflexota bacterium]